MAVVHGETETKGLMRDLMFRDKARKMSFVTETPGKGVQEALLEYETLERSQGMSLLRIHLLTGRTHQIRCQFSHHGFPLVGERKYSTRGDPWPLALWSCSLGFTHPGTGKRLNFEQIPPDIEPWTSFNNLKTLAKSY